MNNDSRNRLISKERVERHLNREIPPTQYAGGAYYRLCRLVCGVFNCLFKQWFTLSCCVSKVGLPWRIYFKLWRKTHMTRVL